MTDTTAMTDSLRQYIATAMWSSTVELGNDETEPMDDNHDVSNLAPETLVRMAADCEAFETANADDIAAHDDPTLWAHDFWLTRNGHGAGFWDGDWPEPQASRLDKASEKFGTCDLYVGDDGLIYAM